MMTLNQKGVALIIALVLLLILTLLATTGLAMAIGDLKMAGNEQFHRQASDAASAGIEASIARLSAHQQEITTTGQAASAEYLATARYAARETSLPGFSTARFAGVHYEIESTAQAGRRAIDEQVQGVMLIVAGEGAETFMRTGVGLGGGSP